MLRRAVICLAGMLAMAKALPAEARATTFAIDYNNQTWRPPNGRPQTQASVKQLILRAVQAARWQAQSVTDASIIASLDVRGKHNIKVAISFNETSFSVTYNSSENMDAWAGSDGRILIHPNYNAWTQRLVTAIRAELERI